MLGTSLSGDCIDDTTTHLAGMLRWYDQHTYEHSLEVSLNAAKFSEYLNQDHAYDLPVEHIWKGGLLHDIGKLMIPKDILDLDRKLTSEETGIVAKHLDYGKDIILGNTYPRLISEICGLHHPQQGEHLTHYLNRVPEAVGIVSLIDRYTAGTEERNYKPAWSPLHSLTMLTMETGHSQIPLVDHLKSYVLDRKILSRPDGTSIH